MQKGPDPQPAPDVLGQALRVARTLRGATLREISDATGIHVRRLSQYEWGHATPGPAEFLAVWTFLASPFQKEEGTERG